MTTKVPISVVVPVRNEAANLARCLARLSRFSEVIVVDSGSTDGTQQIALKHGAQLVNFEWDRRYPKKRNWILLNRKLNCDWVLFIDADELVNDRFVEAANSAVCSCGHNGYWLNYTNYFLGQPLRFGIPQRKLALFRVGYGLYERIEEEGWSSLDMEVHEHPAIEGSVGEIRVRIDHNDDRGILKFIDRHREYAVWESKRIQLLMSKDESSWDQLTRRQRFKYRNLEKWWYPYFYFLFQYIVKGGVIDGYCGLQYAMFKYWYYSVIVILCATREEEGEELAF